MENNPDKNLTKTIALTSTVIPTILIAACLFFRKFTKVKGRTEKVDFDELDAFAWLIGSYLAVYSVSVGYLAGSAYDESRIPNEVESLESVNCLEDIVSGLKRQKVENAVFFQTKDIFRMSSALTTVFLNKDRILEFEK